MSGLQIMDEDEKDGRIVIARAALPATNELTLVDASWGNALTAIEERVSSLVIKSADQAQIAADLQRRVTTAGIELNKARIALKAPYKAIVDSIDAAAGAADKRIETVKQQLKKGLADFDEAERKRIIAEENARKAEVARLAAIVEAERKATEAAAAAALKAQQEAQAKADAEKARIAAENEAKRLAGLPAPPKPMDLGLDDDEDEEPVTPPAPPPKSDAQIALEQAQHAPATVAAKPVGIMYRVTLEIEAADVAQLPDPFVTKTANLQALRAAYCLKYKDGDTIPVCPGVTFKVKREPISTRQRI